MSTIKISNATKVYIKHSTKNGDLTIVQLKSVDSLELALENTERLCLDETKQKSAKSYEHTPVSRNCGKYKQMPIIDQEIKPTKNVPKAYVYTPLSMGDFEYKITESPKISVAVREPKSIDHGLNFPRPVFDCHKQPVSRLDKELPFPRKQYKSEKYDEKRAKELDEELDAYMAKRHAKVDKELDEYMQKNPRTHRMRWMY